MSVVQLPPVCYEPLCWVNPYGALPPALIRPFVSGLCDLSPESVSPLGRIPSIGNLTNLYTFSSNRMSMMSLLEEFPLVATFTFLLTVAPTDLPCTHNTLEADFVFKAICRLAILCFCYSGTSCILSSAYGTVHAV